MLGAVHRSKGWGEKGCPRDRRSFGQAQVGRVVREASCSGWIGRRSRGEASSRDEERLGDASDCEKKVSKPCSKKNEGEDAVATKVLMRERSSNSGCSLISEQRVGKTGRRRSQWPDPPEKQSATSG